MTEQQPLKRGDLLVAFADDLPRRRLYLEVTRVAKDGTWADIRVCNCFVMWTKRQRLDERGMPPHAERRRWDQRDLDDQVKRWDETDD